MQPLVDTNTSNCKCNIIILIYAIFIKTNTKNEIKKMKKIDTGGQNDADKDDKNVLF